MEQGGNDGGCGNGENETSGENPVDIRTQRHDHKRVFNHAMGKTHEDAGQKYLPR